MFKKVPDYASLNSFAEDLKLLPIAPRTQEAYLACVRQWAEHFHTAPELIRPEQFRQYFLAVALKAPRQRAHSKTSRTLAAQL